MRCTEKESANSLPVLDYSEYIELVFEREGQGTWGGPGKAPGVWGGPSVADTQRYAPHFISRSDKPLDPKNVTTGEQLIIEARLDLFNMARQHSFGKLSLYGQCPYCGTVLSRLSPSPQAPQIVEVLVLECPSCQWWEMEEVLSDEFAEARFQGERQLAHVGRSVRRRAVLKHFAVSDTKVPIGRLTQYLFKHADKITHIHPDKMEELVAHIFSESMDCEVRHVGGPGDGGIDLLVIEGERTIAIQVKRRESHSKSEPVSVVREFPGALILGSRRRGILVTSAPRFTAPAVRAAGRAVDLGAVDLLRLHNRDDLFAMISQSKVGLWQRAVTRHDTLEDHVQYGRDLFIDAAMDDPDWRLSHAAPRPSERTRLKELWESRVKMGEYVRKLRGS